MTIDIPIFGVFYGHQLMAHALGMRSRLSPKRSIVRMPYDILMPFDGASFLPAPGKFALASFASDGQAFRRSTKKARPSRASFWPGCIGRFSLPPVPPAEESKPLPQCSLN
ncbi:hypothetical protein [Paraburkholderia hospita]|uniref:hypothetical protein n=1 Tax=Paraburkholderia hospita TaxID=169430 RepID=UPI002ED52525